MRRWILAFSLLAAGGAGGLGCGPGYPYCENDQNCRSGEYCVLQNCQQCRHANDCSAGQRCLEGRCE